MYMDKISFFEHMEAGKCTTFSRPKGQVIKNDSIHINQNAPALLMYMLTIPDPMVRRRVKKGEIYYGIQERG